MNKVPITIMQWFGNRWATLCSIVLYAMSVSLVFINSILPQSRFGSDSDSYCWVLIQIGHMRVPFKCNVYMEKWTRLCRSNRIPLIFYAFLPSNVVRWFIAMHDLTSDFKFIGALLTLKTSRKPKTLKTRKYLKIIFGYPRSNICLKSFIFLPHRCVWITITRNLNLKYLIFKWVFWTDFVFHFICLSDKFKVAFFGINLNCNDAMRFEVTLFYSHSKRGSRVRTKTSENQ